ncbi:MAG: h16 [Ramlibacter sp.]|nr:h16 [Ramlibacter sp.]
MGAVNQAAEMTHPPVAPSPRSTYRHGDLHRALLEAGVSLARDGGPAAVTLREATRRAGVVPNAAYRHFASHSELLAAVRSHALASAALSMELELEALAPLAGRRTKAQVAVQARARLRAVGMGYVRFAVAEPGLFRTAFASLLPPAETGDDPAARGRSGLGPYQLLAAALDELVAAGVLPPGRRPHAEFVAWSAVHGLAMLVMDGPLHGTPPREIESLTEQVLDMVDRGI